MMNRFFLVGLLFTTICNAQSGIKFEKSSTWPEVKKIGKEQGKYIFVDAFITMTNNARDKKVFSQEAVGSFINQHFVSFKLQTDSSEFDDEQVRKNYPYAHEIRSLLNKGVFPAYLFFDPSGKLVHALPITQALSPDRFLEEAVNALDTSKQYFTLVNNFYKGKLPFRSMPDLIRKGQTLQDKANVRAIAERYTSNYLFALPEIEQLTKENIPIIALVTKSSTGAGFSLFIKKGAIIDSIINIKDYSNNIIESIIVKEDVEPILSKSHSPDWNAIYRAINKKYNANFADRIVLSEKVNWFNNRKDWPAFTDAFLTKAKKYGYDTSWLGKSLLNNAIFDIIFKNNGNKVQLQQAAQIMEELIRTNPNKTSWIDTYANLLYKAGDKSRAIAEEEKASKLDPSNDELKKVLQLMKSGQPTWTKSGENGGHLKTKWSEDVSSKNVLSEYPRPQMIRCNWTNLNGFWEYTIVDSSINNNLNFSDKILVPYPLESALSQVKKTLQPDERLWYKKVVVLKETEKNKRYLLHFGAVDYNTTVFVNDRKVGNHIGGYQEFSFDVTKEIRKGDNVIMVSVLDPTDKGNNPHGKQVLEPQGIMYTPSSGIWQTVWMETVPPVYIDGITLTPDVDNQQLKLQVHVDGNAENYSIEAMATDAGNVKGLPNTQLYLPIPDAHLWSLADPYLYDLSVKLLYKGKIVDTIKSYFGMRKIEIKKDDKGQERIFLNNQYTFNMGVLDQGFWPDGIYTAPTDNALKFDIETIKAMGFNTIRKHIKIEPSRWYYWCDRLGMLVWQDMPYPANLSAAAKEEFEKESEQNIKQLYNYPSIICWVLFNEGWNRYDQERLTKWMKNLDPTRLIDGHSGENYDRKSPSNINDKWINSDMTDIHDYPGPSIAPYLPGKARVLGEWGGVRVATPGHQWNESKSWGYIESDVTDFARKYEFMMKHLKLFEEEGLSAAIYTQPFDVEVEENGLVTYDRKIFKIPIDQIKKINQMFFYRKNTPEMAGVK